MTVGGSRDIGGVSCKPYRVGERPSYLSPAAGLERRETAPLRTCRFGKRVHQPRRVDTDVMLAGNWKTSRMVAHYSAGATAERGAVARYL